MWGSHLVLVTLNYHIYWCSNYATVVSMADQAVKLHAVAGIDRA